MMKQGPSFSQDQNTSKDSLPKYEQVFIDNEKYRKLAHELYQAHLQEIIEVENQYDPTHPIPTIQEGLNKIDPEVLSSYMGHGITRGNDETQIASVINIMENNAVRGGIGALAKSGYIDAYSHGGFLVIFSKSDTQAYSKKTFEEKKCSRLEVVSKDGDTGYALKFTPLAVVCSGQLSPLAEPLQKMFPTVKILRPNELSKFIMEQEKDSQ
jgi:hypothetical protein